MGNEAKNCWAQREAARREKSGDAGWNAGPKIGEKVVVKPTLNVKPQRAARKAEASDTAEDLKNRESFLGNVTPSPFRARRVRSKRWYSKWALRASHLITHKKNIKLEFPGTSLSESLSVFEVLKNLPYRLHKEFEGKRRVSIRKYDKKAKELLETRGDVWGKYGAMQVLLAYWRAFKRMKKETNSSSITANTELVLSIKSRRRLWKRRPTAKPRPITTINSTKELYEYNSKHAPETNPIKDGFIEALRRRNRKR